MNHSTSHSSNQRFHQVQEELKNLLSIIMGTVAEEAQNEQNFEYFEQNATSEEELTTIKELRKSTQEIEEKAKNYYHTIGIPSAKKQAKQSKKQITSENNVSTIQPIATQNKENSKNSRISRIQDDFDIEH